MSETIQHSGSWTPPVDAAYREGARAERERIEGIILAYVEERSRARGWRSARLLCADIIDRIRLEVSR